jgi:hypothetical protein
MKEHWREYIWLMIGASWVIGWAVDYVILGNGTGTSAKVFSFMAGYFACSALATYSTHRQDRGEADKSHVNNKLELL